MKKAVLAGWAVAALFALPAAATTVIALDVPALTRISDVVVHGVVRRVEARWTRDKLRILTDIDVEVKDQLKGVPAKQFRVVQPGGVVGDIGQKVDGVATFKPGEEVFLFLEHKGGQHYLVTGMAQGKFSVERSTDQQAAFAIPDPGGHVLLLDPVTRQPVERVPTALPLNQLKAQVRALLPPAQQTPPAEEPQKVPLPVSPQQTGATPSP